jgi:hypothetical protein
MAIHNDSRPMLSWGACACYGLAMPVGRIDDVVGGNDGLWPGELFAYAAAAAATAAAGTTTSFRGVFVDIMGRPTSLEGWDIVHAQSVDVGKMQRFCSDVAPQDHVEYGAIAVIAAVLHVRDGLRLSGVRKVGTRSDYSLRDPCGNAAGVIELAGRSGRYTSDVAEKKRKNVKRSKVRPARIGIVAFGGPELRSEVVA